MLLVICVSSQCVLMRRDTIYAKDKDEGKDEEIMEDDDGDDETRNQDYHLLAERGREANEVVELLKDSKIRLKHSVREMEMYNLRRQTMMD